MTKIVAPTNTLPPPEEDVDIQDFRQKALLARYKKVESDTQYIYDMVQNAIPRINIDTFARLYLEGLMSADEVRAGYTRNELGKRIGGVIAEFYLTDMQDNILFHITGLVPKFRTATDGPDSENPQITAIARDFEYSTYKNFPAHILENQEVICDLARQIMNHEDSEHAFYMGWYEVFDFFTQIKGEEEEMYASIRVKRQNAGYYYFWRHEIPMDEYLEKNGRIQFPFLNYQETIIDPAFNPDARSRLPAPNSTEGGYSPSHSQSADYSDDEWE